MQLYAQLRNRISRAGYSVFLCVGDVKSADALNLLGVVILQLPLGTRFNYLTSGMLSVLLRI